MDLIKKILFAATLLSSVAFGCEIEWQNSLSQAKKLSSKTKKPIMVFVTSTTCPYCTIMSETTFEDEAVCKLVNSKFVPLIALDGTADVPKSVKVRGVPSVGFVDASERELAPKIIGLRDNVSFASDIELRFKR